MSKGDEGMTILVVGGGGREHSLALGLLDCSSVGTVHVTPGNAGTAEIAQNHDVEAGDIDGLVNLAESLSTDLVIAGPEGPLVAGLADKLRSNGIPCFGPDSGNAMLEGSKLRAKRVMSEYGVPTAGFDILDADSDIDAALDGRADAPWVVKRDVLAGGKGVVVTEDRAQARAFITDSIERDGAVLLEAFLPGEEASVLVVMDESGFVCLPPSQDHKRVGEADTGPNTGGMGAYCPAPVITPEVDAKVIARVVRPMHEGLSSLEIPYRGVLYVGLMIDADGDPYVVEFNVRFGDPECQVTIPLIASDLGEMLSYAAQGRLVEHTPRFHDLHCLTVVLASEGYPGPPRKGLPITGLALQAKGDSWVNHAGTGLVDGTLVSTGGRVLSLTGVGEDLTVAAGKAYALIDDIHLEGSHHRRDIGYRAL